MIVVNSRQEFLDTLKQYLPPNPVGAELGVLNGDFSHMVLFTLNPSYYALVDPYTQSEERYGEVLGNMPTAYSTESEYERMFRRFPNQIESGQFVLVRKYSHEAVNDFPAEVFDFIYIDACHLYECVKRDLDDYFPKMKPGGMICGHDYMNFDSFGVVRAVDEFCEVHNLELTILNPEGGDWAIKLK